MIGQVIGYGLAGLVGMGVIVWRRLTGTEMSAVRVAIGPAGVRQARRGFGPVPFARADRAKPVPWSAITSVSLRPRGEVQVAISFERSKRFWTLWPTVAVLAVVTCSPEQLAALRSRVARWRAPPAND